MSRIWEKLKKRCPKCKSDDLSKCNRYRRKWIQKKRGRWELVEQRLIICNVCSHDWWE